MKRVWVMVLIGAALFFLMLQSAEGARHRDRAYSASGGAAAAPIRPDDDDPPRITAPTNNCTHFNQLEEGPFWLEENIDTANLRSNLSYGVPLNITFKVVNETLSALRGACVPIEQARIDLWQSRYDGRYSDQERDSTVGETWLRGYQYTNSTGHASFYTIFPGWYMTRTSHIHVRVRIYEAEDNTTSYDDTTQCFFDDTISTAIYNNVYPYNSRDFAVRDTFNNNDSLFRAANVLNLIGSYNNTDGYSAIVELSLPLSSLASTGADGKSINNGGLTAIL